MSWSLVASHLGITDYDDRNAVHWAALISVMRKADLISDSAVVRLSRRAPGNPMWVPGDELLYSPALRPLCWTDEQR